MADETLTNFGPRVSAASRAVMAVEIWALDLTQTQACISCKLLESSKCLSKERIYGAQTFLSASRVILISDIYYDYFLLFITYVFYS